MDNVDELVKLELLDMIPVAVVDDNESPQLYVAVVVEVDSFDVAVVAVVDDVNDDRDVYYFVVVLLRVRGYYAQNVEDIPTFQGAPLKFI